MDWIWTLYFEDHQKCEDFDTELASVDIISQKKETMIFQWKFLYDIL